MRKMNKLPKKKTQTIGRSTAASIRTAGQASDTTSVTNSGLTSSHIIHR